MIVQRILLALSVLMFNSPRPAFAGGFDVEKYGFALGTFSYRLSDSGPDGPSDAFVLFEERYRSDLTIWPEDIEGLARFKFDFVHDVQDGDLWLDLREGYVDSYSDDYDFRIGRQVATWGTGDLIFINDWFPKNWESFFGGRPLEYLKSGVDGLRTRYTSNDYSWEFYLVPLFEPDQLPSSDRFSFFDPFSEIPTRLEDKPDVTIGNTELAFRLYGMIENFDVALYAYRGYWRAPGISLDNFEAPTTATTFYPRLSIYGLSAQGAMWDGIVSFEAGYYHSRNDAGGQDPMVPNSQVRLLLGYNHQLDDNTNVSVQYYSETMQNHGSYMNTLPDGFPSMGQYRDMVTFRYDRWYMYRTLNLGAFVFYSPRDEDYLIQPMMMYKIRDDLSVTFGMNFFGGKDGTSFLGQFDKNDNIYCSVRYDF